MDLTAAVARRLSRRAERAALRRGRPAAARSACEGVGKRYSAAMVKVFWLDGQSRVYTLTAAQPSVQLYGSADDQRGMGEIARPTPCWASSTSSPASTTCCSCWRCCSWSASTAGWCGRSPRSRWRTASRWRLSALGWLTLRSPPVEATIALSIMLVAGEALHERPHAVAALAGAGGVPVRARARPGLRGRAEGHRPAAEPPVGGAADASTWASKWAR